MFSSRPNQEVLRPGRSSATLPRRLSGVLLAPPIPAVLVVEADPDMRGAMADALHADGYEVSMAINCKEALRVLEHMDMPCLILLDFSPFTLGGGDFLARLRADAARSAVPVVALAGEPGPTPVGVTATLRKPVRLQTLLSVVATHRRPR